VDAGGASPQDAAWGAALVVDMAGVVARDPALEAAIVAAGHRVWTDADPLAADPLRRRVEEADAVIAGAREAYDAELLARAKRLRVISRTGVGYDRIDVDAATRRGIVVTITPGALEESVADHTLLLLLAVARRLRELDAGTRAGRWTRVMGRELQGKRLGILGLGRIGRAVARRAQAFGMAVWAYDPVPDPAYARQHNIRLVDDWPTLVETVDVVSLHLPLTPSTRRLVDADFLARMRPGSLFINTARGGLVDQDALVEALAGGHLGGAGLDVFDPEPVSEAHPLLARLPADANVVLTPHVASYTAEASAAIARQAVNNALMVLSRQHVDGIVNPAAWDPGPHRGAGE